MIHLFPTSRAVRQFYDNMRGQDTLLPVALGIFEFELKALIVSNLTLADEDTRVLLMQEAAKFENFASLKIPQEFMAFLRNSQFLFRFFEELSAEKRTFEDLEGADTYAEFDEHLRILKVLKVRYVELLSAKGLYDRITLPSVYELNEEYISSLEGVHLHVEGYLSRFEMELFTKISKITPVYISMNVNKYSQKMVETFAKEGILIEGNGDITFELGKKEILKFEKTDKSCEIVEKSFSNRSLQAGYIFHKIKEMVDEGIEPENIAVVLPDESFVEILKRFDAVKNLNFAMGKSFEFTKIFKHLKALEKALNENTVESKHRLKRLGIEEINIKEWQEIWSKKVNFENFEKSVTIEKIENEDEKRLFQEELYRLKQLLLHHGNLRFNQLLQLFLRRLTKLSIDDVGGGKVTVMGVLETRGMTYEGIIIPDFNDNLVPKRSHKDLFLSSTLRKHAGLPDSKDRENLQRFFYETLINRAKKVAISYVKNEESVPARFLKALHVKSDDRYEEELFAPYLMEKRDIKEQFLLENLVDTHDFFAFPLSASRLKTYLSCPRKYYFSYVKNFKDSSIPSDEIEAMDVGNLLHKSLQVLYTKSDMEDDAKALHVRLEEIIKELIPKGEQWLLEGDIWSYRLRKFCQNEVFRYKEGWRVHELEIPKNVTFKGVELKGVIDRIDVNRLGEFSLLDYKSGSFNKTTPKDLKNLHDFQMQFYYLFVSRMGSVKEVAYYDLKEGELFFEKDMDDKIQRLGEAIEEMKEKKEIDFHMCEKISSCRYCPYVKLCGRG